MVTTDVLKRDKDEVISLVLNIINKNQISPLDIRNIDVIFNEFDLSAINFIDISTTHKKRKWIYCKL